MFEPEKYENAKSFALRDAAEFVPKLVDLLGPWTPKENVLDYGCGAGSTAHVYILPSVTLSDSKLYSVDVSNEMLDFAIKQYSHPKITYAQGDIALNFPFTDIKFDKIFSIYVFHFMKDMRKFLDILKPGGRLGFTVVTKLANFSIIKRLGESETWKESLRGYDKFLPDWMNYESGEDHDRVQGMLQQAGFSVTHLEVLERSYFYEDIETLLDLFLWGCPMLASIPKQLHQQYKEDVRKLLTGDAGIPLDSKQFTLEYETILAVIEKPKKSLD